MGTVPARHDNGRLSCGRTSDAVPVGVMTEYNGDEPREGERAWLRGAERPHAPVQRVGPRYLIGQRDEPGLGGPGSE